MHSFTSMFIQIADCHLVSGRSLYRHFINTKYNRVDKRTKLYACLCSTMYFRHAILLHGGRKGMAALGRGPMCMLSERAGDRGREVYQDGRWGKHWLHQGGSGGSALAA